MLYTVGSGYGYFSQRSDPEPGFFFSQVGSNQQFPDPHSSFSTFNPSFIRDDKILGFVAELVSKRFSCNVIAHF